MPDDRLPKPRLIRQPLRISFLIGDPPDPLPLQAGGLMHPQSITTLYGAGGIGKGFVAAWAYVALIEEGYNPLILDFEGVRDEWWTRIRWLGHKEPIWHYEAESRLTVPYAADIAETVRVNEITHIILDSASTARGKPTDNDSGGSDITVDMFKAMKSWGVPVLLLAHEPKHGEGPIGSIHFQSQSRLMWRAKAVPNGTELRMTKANDVPMDERPVTFYRVPAPNGGVTVQKEWPVYQAPEVESMTDAILRIVTAEARLIRPSEVHEILTREGVVVSEAYVNTAMYKMRNKGRLIRPEKGRYTLPTHLPPLGGMG